MKGHKGKSKGMPYYMSSDVEKEHRCSFCIHHSIGLVPQAAETKSPRMADVDGMWLM
jgi:hypothetical protein